MYYKTEQLKNILANHKNCVFSLDHLCSSVLEYIQHLEAGIDRCYELAKRVEAAQPKWISIKERLPETGLRVLVCDGRKTVKAGCIFGKDKIGKQWKWYIERTYQNDITHWAYMPEPPKEDV